MWMLPLKQMLAEEGLPQLKSANGRSSVADLYKPTALPRLRLVIR